MRSSKTTNNLLTEMNKFKSNKEAITTKLQGSIEKNNEVIEDTPLLQIGYKHKVFIKRNKSIDLLQKKMNHRIDNDKKNDIAIEMLAFKSQKRKEKLEKRLSQLSQRNQQRISQLKNIQQNILNKISIDIKKNQLKEKHLKMEYQKLKKQEEKLGAVNVHQKKEAFQQWRIMQNEKWKLQIFARENEQKQKLLIKDKNPKPTKKQQKKRDNDKNLPNQKEFRLRNPQSKDMKQVGNKYLQQAKVLHRQTIQNNKKKKLLNLNLKVINYDKQIMQKIARNTSQLSKYVNKKNINNVSQKIINNQEKQIENQMKQEKSQMDIQEKIKSDFIVSEDLQTQRYLKKIKGDIEYIQKVHNQQKNPEEVEIEESRKQTTQNQLIVPATFNQGNQFL